MDWLKCATVLVAVVLALSGCTKQAEETTAAGVGEFQVDRLFTVDGCTVYRFEDAGRNRYFSRCSGSSSVTWQTEEPCGKNCVSTVDHEVQTGYSAPLEEEGPQGAQP